MRLVRHFDESTGQIYVAVNELEPNHRLASALKLVVVCRFRGDPHSFDAIAARQRQLTSEELSTAQPKPNPGCRPPIMTSYQSGLAHSAYQQPGCQIDPSER